jgi:hypothetical protein
MQEVRAILENSFFESVGVINNLSSSNFAYIKYVSFAITKIKDCIMILDTFKKNIKNLSVVEAKENLLLLEQYDTFLKNQKKELLKMNSIDFVVVKNISLEYLNSIIEAKELLEEIVIDHNLGRMMTESKSELSEIPLSEFMLQLKKRINDNRAQ